MPDLVCQFGNATGQEPIAATVPDYLRRLDAAMADFTTIAQEMAAGDTLDSSYIDVLDDPPTVGFFAAGELGPVGGRNFMHGFTASVVLFEDP